MLKSLLVLVMLLPLMSEAAHITDKLLAGMYASPNSAEQPIQLLPSGTPLELLGEKEGFVKIQLVDGKVGWVEKRFLSEEKPANVRLLALQSKHRNLQNKLDVAIKKLAAPSTSKKQQSSLVNSLQQSEERLKKMLLEAEEEIQGLKKVAEVNEVGDTKLQMGVQKVNASEPLGASQIDSSITWFVVLTLIALGVAAGVFIGIRIQDQRQLKKHGGFRI